MKSITNITNIINKASTTHVGSVSLVKNGFFKTTATLLMAILVASTGAFGAMDRMRGTNVNAAGNKLIAITFDDGPSAATTPGLLDGLAERGAKATFFVNATNASHGAANHPDIIARMVEDGHQVANHTASHRVPFTSLSAEAMNEQCQIVRQLLFEAAGGEFQDFVRTPGGAQSSRVSQNVHAPIIQWSVDTWDWRDRNSGTVYRRIVNGAFDGAIILCHDLYPSTVRGALDAISTLQQQGYEFVTVAELMRRRGIEPVNGVVYFDARNNGTTLPAYGAPTITSSYDLGSMQHRVTITPEFSTQEIYYTTDGSTPRRGQGSTRKYDGTFSAAVGTQIRAIAYDRYATRSQEVSHQITYVEPLSAGRTNQQFIDTLYIVLLGRTPTAEDEQQILASLNSGASKKQITDNILASAEFQSACTTVTSSDMSSARARVANFVNRLYSVVLGRGADGPGLAHWTGYILTMRTTPSSVARGFFESPEFQSRALSNGEYVNVLYQSILGRNPDGPGFDHWVGMLDNGASRASILDGFLGSQEWANICATYGLSANSTTITSGGANEGSNGGANSGANTPANITPNEQIYAFVDRMYSNALGRGADADGRNHWAVMLASGQMNATDIGYSFFDSPEFVNAGHSDAEFITRLYRTFLGREPDAPGFDHWMSVLNSGTSRHDMIINFTMSREFYRICLEYGIAP